MTTLLDTTVYVAFKRNVLEVVERIVSARRIIFSPPIVLAELMFGFRNGTRYKENMADLNRFLGHRAVDPIPMGEISAERYSRIAAQLRKQGTPLPTNDIWIAAHTIEQGAQLITADHHFEKIDGLVYSLFA